MKGWMLILVWIGCVIVGALAGYGLGMIMWSLGFELLGSSVALVGAGLGGILMFLGALEMVRESPALGWLGNRFVARPRVIGNGGTRCQLDR